MADVLRLAVAIQGVNNFSSAFTQASSQIGGIRGKIVGLGAGLAKAGPAIAFFAAAAAASFAKAAIKIASSFENEMLKVSAVTNATGDQYKQLTEFAKTLGETTEFTAIQSAEAMTIFGRAGFSVNEIYETTPVALDLATAGMTDMATSAAVLSNVLRGFQFETEEAGRVADVLTYTANNSFTSIETLTESFKMAIPMASSAGIEFEELSAAIGIMGNMGIQGTMAGTGLRQAIAKLLDPSEDAIKTMSRLGVELVTMTDSGNQAQASLDLALPTYQALQEEQESLKITSRDLGIQMSGLGIDVAKNNIEIGNHENAIEIITQEYTTWGDEIGTLKSELTGLEDVMSGFSLQSKKNNLEVMEIRQQADREGRALSEEEISRIGELGEANDELAINRERLAIDSIELQQQISAEEANRTSAIISATSSEINAIETLKSQNAGLSVQRAELNIQTQETTLTSQLLGIELGLQKTNVDSLTQSLEGQVTGTQSLIEILTQLKNAGATTSDMMEIFSIRGGSAMLSLQNAGVDALTAFTNELLNADGALASTAETMRSGMTQEVKLLESAWAGLQIELGTAFFPVLKQLIGAFKEILPAIQEIVKILPLLLEQVIPIITKFLEVISVVSESSGQLDLLSAVISAITPVFDILAPILSFVMDLFSAMAPIIEAIGPIIASLTPLIEGAISVLDLLLPIFDALTPVIEAIGLVLVPIIDAVVVLIPIFQKIATLVSDVLTVVFEALTPVIGVLATALEGLTPLMDAIVGVVEVITPLFDALIPVIGDLLAPTIDTLSVVFSALTPILDFVATYLELLTPTIKILTDIIISLLPILNLMNLPLMMSVKILEFFLPLLEILTPMLKLMTPLFELVAWSLKPVAFFFELVGGGVDQFVNLLSGAFSPMEVFTNILDGLKASFDFVMAPIKWLIDSVNMVWNIISPFEKLGEVLSPIVGFFKSIWDFISSIIDGVADLVGGIGDFFGDIGSGVSDFFSFETGTGLSGVPKTSLYQLHEGEIVLNPGESDSLREAQGVNSGLLRSSPQTSTTQNSGITIGNIEVHANSEAEGRDAVRGVMKELESLNVRGDVEVL